MLSVQAVVTRALPNGQQTVQSRLPLENIEIVETPKGSLPLSSLSLREQMTFFKGNGKIEPIKVIYDWLDEVARVAA